MHHSDLVAGLPTAIRDIAGILSTMTRTLISLVLTSLALAGCAPTSATTSDTGPTSPASTMTPSASADAATVALQEFDSTCTDPSGDGQGAADVVEVHLISDGSLVFVTYRLASSSQVSDFSDISFLTMAFNADQKHGYQFGSIFLGGQEASNYIIELDNGQQTNITNGVLFADGQVSMRYPVADLAKLGDNFSWYGVVSIGADDVDFCAGPLTDSILVGNK